MHYSLCHPLPEKAGLASLQLGLGIGRWLHYILTIMIKTLLRSVWCLACCLLLAHHAVAQSLIRDAETEDTLRRMSDPIFEAAGITPSAVRLFILNAPSINAFVAGGQNIFFHTGLLLEAQTPQMLMGVIAHEVGHISGAHLTQLAGAASDATLGALLSTILGAAAILAGSAQGGAAIISGGQNTSLRQLLAHYRGNEQQADQAGIRYMQSLGLSPEGMLDMFELLRRNERQHIGSGADPYLRTHPLTTDRIAALRNKVKEAENLPAAPSADIQKRFARMQAKLFAFLNTPSATLARFPKTQQTEEAHLARAVAYFKQPNLALALEEMHASLALNPSAFSYDLLGQILFEHSRIQKAINAYEQAHLLAPQNGLIMSDLGRAYLAQDGQPHLQQAISLLERASLQSSASAGTHRYLAIAYGQSGQLGKSYLSLAREAALNNQPDDVIRYARQAKEHIKSNQVLSLQADDLIEDAKQVKLKNDS